MGWFVAGYKWHYMDEDTWKSLCGRYSVLAYATALKNERTNEEMDENNPDLCKTCLKKLKKMREKKK